MSRKCYMFTFLVTLVLCLCPVCLCEEISPSNSPADYGRAAVDKALRVDPQCRIICDIQGWPAIIGKEIPVQIRGLDPKQSFDLPARQFILETLTAALSRNSTPADPNRPALKVLLKHIQRGQTFSLIADVEVDGKDLAGLLVDKGYAKKVIIPKTAAVTSATPAAGEHPAAAEGYVASKSGKVFHKSTCSHVRRIQDNTKIIYQTREEAIAAGRRPCQTCNP